MAAFDPAIEMQQIEEMDEVDVKKELAAAREDTGGTRRRLNERLHARRCKDAAEATAADEGDEMSPLSDADLAALVRNQRNPNIKQPTATQKMSTVPTAKSKMIIWIHASSASGAAKISLSPAVSTSWYGVPRTGRNE